MPSVIKIIVFSFIGFHLFGNATVSREPEFVRQECSDDHIKTILFYRSNQELSLPVLFHQEDEKLTLRFDYIGEPEENYSYSVTACSYDWKLNEISDHLYLDGFNDNLVENSYSSFNTTKYYKHYMTEVPSPDMEILVSGNYILRVYESSDPRHIIFTRKFCIAETEADIQATVKKPDHQNQELNIEIDPGKLGLVNPMQEIKVVVIKNNDWNNKVDIAFKPVLRDNKLYFDLPYQLITGGVNEFRYFDIKSIKYVSDRVDSIRYLSPETHFYVKHDELRQFTPYFSSTDLNGLFYIDMPDAYNRHTESDYVHVHFTLKAPRIPGMNVFIYGALTGWKTDKSNCMNYNTQRGEYKKSLFLKQGYYNYAYCTVNEGSKEISFDLTEGNHSEAENDYAIFVYLCQPMSDFDRLIGYRIINSAGKEPVTANPDE
jgi:hypothetical protein